MIGDVVNTASRLEALTKEKGVPALVSEETRRRAGAAFTEDLIPLGEVAIRGRTEPLRVHALGSGTGSAAARAPGAPQQRPGQ